MTNTPTDPVVEMKIGGVWVDITDDCRLGSSDSGGGIEIVRGTPNEGNAAEPTQVDCTVNNASGKYSPKNPNSEYWGLLGRNQPVRVGLDRRSDSFVRAAASDTWGSLPDRIDRELKTIAGDVWQLNGTATSFDLTGTTATIQQIGAGDQVASFGTYSDVEVLTKIKMSNRTSETGVVLRYTVGTGWYSAYFTPQTAPTPDLIRIGKVVSSAGFAIAFSRSWPGGNYVAGTYYWLKAQAAGHRMRVKVWADGDDEPLAWDITTYDNRANELAGPTSGQVGVLAGAGGTCLLTVDSFEVNQWRAHAEIAQLPPRWDLSRQDRWVPVQARGILRRLGQGRKNPESAVRRHLKRYTPSALWIPLENSTGDQASNEIQGGLAAVVKDLEFGAPELSGDLAMPGIAGFAHFNENTSSLNAQAIRYDTSDGVWTLLFFFRVPANPATALTSWIALSTTGTARIWRFTIETDRSITVQALRNDLSVLDSDTAVPYTVYPGSGWIAATLYVFNDGGGNVDWAFNYHQPGDDTWWTVNGTYVGSVGAFRSAYVRSDAAMATAGGFYLSHLFHYAGDLPFVTSTFARAAAAYQGEEAADRWMRLAADAGLNVTIMGNTDDTDPMGAQLPDKLLNLLEDCAAAQNSFIMEERDDFALALQSRDGLYNTEPLALDVDEGHLSAPLEPVEDDQLTRNDVTATRPNGGFAVSRQTTGPLNINEPGTDPDGVGAYDSAPEFNLGGDQQLQAAADWIRALGTLDEARYPTMRADLTSTTYQGDRTLTVRALAIDSGRIIDLSNSEVSPDVAPQIVQSYSEHIDMYEHDLTWVTRPGRLWTVGVVGNTSKIIRYRNEARVQPAGIVTQASFVAGTATEMSVEATGTNELWYPTVDDPKVADFTIRVAGVELQVRVVGRILNSNSDFETGTITGTWVTTGAGFTVSIDSVIHYAGSYSCKVAAAGAGTGGNVQDAAASAVTVAATDYVVCGWVRTAAAATDFRFAVDWYQSNNTTFISSSTPAPIVTAANTWTWYSAVVTSPALGVRARVKSRNVFAGATNMWVDNLRLIPVSSYNTTPQILTVDQVPINGVIKTIPAGERLLLGKPARVAW